MFCFQFYSPLFVFVQKNGLVIFYLFNHFFISKRTKLLFAWPAFFRNYLLVQNYKSLCNFWITCTKNSAIFKFKIANVINSQFINRKYKTALHWILTTNSQLQYMTYKAYYVYTPMSIREDAMLDVPKWRKSPISTCIPPCWVLLSFFPSILEGFLLFVFHFSHIFISIFYFQ